MGRRLEIAVKTVSLRGPVRRGLPETCRAATVGAWDADSRADPRAGEKILLKPCLSGKGNYPV